MKRVIPIVLIAQGRVVLSRNFARHSIQGDPNQILSRLLAWDSDEVIILDISRNDRVKNFRDDLKLKPDFNTGSSLTDLTRLSSKLTMTPLSVGGKISNLTQIEELLSSGADRVIINSSFSTNRKFCVDAIKEFGGSTIIASVDYKFYKDDFKVFIRNGTECTNTNLVTYCKYVSDLGVSEVLANSIDRDGLGKGFDIEVINKLVSHLQTPIIACGGAGKDSDFIEVLQIEGISGAAAANIFHFKENSMYLLKRNLFESGLPVRKPRIRD